MHTQITTDHLQACVNAQTILSPKAQERLQWLVYHCDHGCSVRETCQHFGLTLVTFYRLLQRFDPADPSTLEDRSRRPHAVRTSAPRPVPTMPASVTVQISTPAIRHAAPAAIQALGHVRCTNPHCIVCTLTSPELRRRCKTGLLLTSVLVNAVFLASLLLGAVHAGRLASADLLPSVSDSAPRK